MGYLSEALRKYYSKRNNRIKFKNGLSLNEFSLLLWEKSSISGIDSSVLSKVLAGKRLFTPIQLDVFCEVLGLNAKEREYLFYCLNKDYNVRHGLKDSSLFVPSIDTIDFLEKLKDESENLLSVGKCDDLLKLTGATESYLEKLLYKSRSRAFDKKLNALYTAILYLKGRAIGSTKTPSEILSETDKISSKLNIHYSITGKTSTGAYSDSLNANAYYVKGSYSDNLENKYLMKAIELGKEVLENLPVKDSEYLFTLRTMIASSIYLNDKDLTIKLIRLARKILYAQPQGNYLNATHLAGTVSKGMAKYKLGDPFKIKEDVEKYFGRNIEGTRIYEISDIKTELETISILGLKDNNYVERKLKKAINIADTENYVRHKDALLKIADSFSVNGL